MRNGHIETSRDVDGHPVVLACLELEPVEASAAAHAVAAVRGERYRLAEMTTDDVLAMRELTALADELGQLATPEGLRLVLRPARLNALRDALEAFVASREEAEWIRGEDREPLGMARSVLWPIADLCADALRAALYADDGATAG